MPLRVLYVNPVGTDRLNGHFERYLAGCAGPDVDVSVTHLAGVDASEGPFLPRVPVYLGVLVEVLHRAQGQGFDAAVIGCSGDPGLLDCRRSLEMPITAPLEASLHLAAMLHPRVAILVADGFEAHVLYQDLARYYGLGHHVSEILTVPMRYPEPAEVARLMGSDPDLACQLVLDRHIDVLDGPALTLARGAVERGAGVVYAGCTLWTGALDQFAARLGVPVIDPGRVAVIAAAAAARARTSGCGLVTAL